MSANPEAGKNRLLEILLVEDNRSDAVLTQKTLAAAKPANRITVAEDGEKALAILRREEKYSTYPVPDIVLLDLGLPKQGGAAILEAMKSDEQLKKIPVVILTGSRAEMDVAKAYDLHASGYIVKPVNLEKFVDLVRTMIWNRTIQLHS